MFDGATIIRSSPNLAMSASAVFAIEYNSSTTFRSWSTSFCANGVTLESKSYPF